MCAASKSETKNHSCHCCGAPLVDGRSAEQWLCEYCQTLHHVYELQDCLDRIRPAACTAHSSNACPRCHQQLTRGSIENMSIEYCQACRGMLIETERLAMAVKRRRSIYQGADDRPQPLDTAQLQIITRCPGCEKRMYVHPYHGPGNVVIDSCSQCHLVWLDHGELASIERAPGVR